MTLVVIIAIAALVLISLLAIVGLAVLAAALYLWMKDAQDDAALHPSAPESNPSFYPVPGDDPATEVFNRGRLFEIFDSDDMDATEVVRMEGGILLDGGTDPALVRSRSPSCKPDKD